MAKSKFNLDRLKAAKTADLFNELDTDEGNPQLEKFLGITKEDKPDKVVELTLDEIRDFGGKYGQHRFRRNEVKIEEITESIKASGVIVPIIVRPDPAGKVKYECLAGHTRRAAAAAAGLETIPAIIRYECSDDEALIIMAASNHQREDLLPSEKGWMYRIEYEGMKKQGERSDLTCDHDGHKLEESKKSIDILAERSEDSRNQIQRYIRLTYLINGLADRVDKKKIPLVMAVDISYLNEMEQSHVETILFADRMVLTKEAAAELKKQMQEKRKEDGVLTVDDVMEIMRTHQKTVPGKKEKYEVDPIFFPVNLSVKERAEYIQKALKYVRDNEVEL